jgi:hypothetical protein
MDCFAPLAMTDANRPRLKLYAASKRLYNFSPQAFDTPGSQLAKVFAPLFSKSGCF